MSIKISFMIYMKWTIVMLPVVFKESELVYIFFTTFFSLSLSIGKRSILAKTWGGCSPPPPQTPVFTGLVSVFEDIHINAASADNTTFFPKNKKIISSLLTNFGAILIISWFQI